MTNLTFRRLSVVFDLVVLTLSALIYLHAGGSDLPDYEIQIVALSATGAILTLLFLGRPERSRYLSALAILRTLAFCLLLLTVPVLDLRFLPATLSFSLLLALHCQVGLFGGLLGFGFAVVAIVLGLLPRVTGLRLTSTPELALYGSSVVFFLVSILVLRWMVSEFRKSREQNGLLTEEIDRLTHANLSFQQYASLLEQETTRAERLRLSREIHDSAGYALTSLKMLFEAAKGVLVKEPAKLDALLDEGARVSQEALSEIRFVLHELRGKEESLPEGMRLVVLLVRNFEKACGIQVRLELTNTKASYGPRVNAAVYRMLQEGMTNAFHHGRATLVTIILAEVDANLSIRIRDNGRGSTLIKKGIGLSGMEERMAEAGGWIQYSNQDQGFEITALVPLKEGP